VLKKFERIEPIQKQSGIGTIKMKIDLEIQGPYKHLRIAWKTCFRPDGTCGFKPDCNNSKTCSIKGVNFDVIKGATNNYQTGTRIAFLSCECPNKKWLWVKKMYKIQREARFGRGIFKWTPAKTRYREFRPRPNRRK